MFTVRRKLERILVSKASSALVLCCLSVFCYCGISHSAQKDDAAVSFRWAFGAVEAANASQLKPITKDTTLKTGDQFKMMVELNRKCFVYLIFHNAGDGLKLLFPYSLDQFGNDYEVKKRYYVPQGASWFELDRNPGREIFHLLASDKRLTELEDLWIRYEAADATMKPELEKKVLEQIRTLKKRHRELASPAERPVAIGGAVRNLNKPDLAGSGSPDVSSIAEEMVSRGFTARTFTIEHQ